MGRGVRALVVMLLLCAGCAEDLSAVKLGRAVFLSSGDEGPSRVAVDPAGVSELADHLVALTAEEDRESGNVEGVVDAVDTDAAFVVAYVHVGCDIETDLFRDGADVRFEAREIADCGVPLTTIEVHEISWENLPDRFRVVQANVPYLESDLGEPEVVAEIRGRQLTR